MVCLKKRIWRYISILGVLCLIVMNSSACGCSSVENNEDAFVQATVVPTQESAEESPVISKKAPSAETTVDSTQMPTAEPSEKSTPAPTVEPTEMPTQVPTVVPTEVPTAEPTMTPIPEFQLDICPVLSVEGTKLVDEKGNTVQLRGVSTHGLAWFPDYVNEECFRQLKEEWGANVVRLAMYTAEYGGYCSGGDKESLKNLVKDGVEYATNQGLYVIIDWHILSDSNPNTYLEEAKAFFGEMAETYADYTNVLYEICNEPNGGTTWSQVKEYAEAVIPVIREKDENGIILVGTPNWCQYVEQAVADPLTGYENIMYTLHFYAATHTDNLRNNMVAALESGLPLFVSEYGICDASGSGNIDEYQAGEWVKLMDAYQVSYVAWNLSNKAETSAFFKSGCNKTSGFNADDLSASGQWVYEILQERAGAIETPAIPTVAPMETTKVPIVPTEVPAGSTNEPSEPMASPTSVPENIELPQAQISAGLTYNATVANSWQQDGNTCIQYSLTITNGAEAPTQGWSVSIPFAREIAVMSSWNGNFKVDGTVLTITPADYNNSIPAGGSLGDIGFILQINQK